MIYLDYSADTPVDPAFPDVFCKMERSCIGKPNATHCAGKYAHEKMAGITENIAQLLGILSEEIIYASGASESSHLAIKGIVQATDSHPPIPELADVFLEAENSHEKYGSFDDLSFSEMVSSIIYRNV